MGKLILYLKKYPLEIILSVLLTSQIIWYPGVTVANFLIVLSLLLGYYMYLSPKKILRLTALLPVLFIATINIFLDSGVYTYIYVSLILFLVLILAYFSKTYRTTMLQKKICTEIMVLGLAIIILFPVTFNLALNFTERADRASLDKTSRTILAKIEEDKNFLEKSAEQLKADPFVSDLLIKSDYPSLSGYVVNYATTLSLNYVVVTDENNVVLARTHSLKMVGDDYTQIMPDLASKPKIFGLFDDHGIMFVAATAEVKQGDKIIGKVIIGEQINEKYSVIKDSSLALSLLSKGDKFTPSGNNDPESLALYRALSNNFAVQKPSIISFHDKRFILQRYSVPQTGADLILVRGVDNYLDAYYYNLCFYLLIALLGILWMRVRSKLSQSDRWSGNRLFSRNKKRVNFDLQHLIVTFFEILLFGSLVFLVSWRSSQAFFLDYGLELPDYSNHSGNAEEPYLKVNVPSYTNVGESFTTLVQTSAIPSGNASVRIMLSYSKDLLVASNIDIGNSICDRVYDNSINELSGTIDFSCVLKYVEDQKPSIQNLAAISFRAKSSGVANIGLNQSYSSLQTSRGQSNKIVQTFIDGEKLIISK